MSIGTVYANGAHDISDSVLGVQIINGTGVLLNLICRDAHALLPTQHNGAIRVQPYQD
jgi:hypothetical protein